MLTADRTSTVEQTLARIIARRAVRIAQAWDAGQLVCRACGKTVVPESGRCPECQSARFYEREAA